MMAVVRISRGWFEADQFSQVKAMLNEGAGTLVPAIERLDGLIAYYVGIDPKTNSMTNTSIWTTDEAASQMSTLKAMLDQRDRFVSIGVRFDPIANYAPLWDING
jgi:hypothetical protein